MPCNLPMRTASALRVWILRQRHIGPYGILIDALRSLTKLTDEEMAPWLAGPGRQTTHHSGLVVYAHQSLKILTPSDHRKGSAKRQASPEISSNRKVGPKRKARAKSEQKLGAKKSKGKIEVLLLNKEKRPFLVEPYSQSIEDALLSLQKFGTALLNIGAPNSLEKWTESMQALTQQVRAAPGLTDSKSYRYKWVVRGFWDFKLREAGTPIGISYEAIATVPQQHTIHTVALFLLALSFSIFSLYL